MIHPHAPLQARASARSYADEAAAAGGRTLDSTREFAAQALERAAEKMRDLRYGVADTATAAQRQMGHYANRADRRRRGRRGDGGHPDGPAPQRPLLRPAPTRNKNNTMLHPLFSVLISKPELVMDHMAGYASLMREEASTVGTEVAKRAIAWGVAVMSFIIFLVLAGVAVMLGVMQDRFHWILLLVPATALALSVAAFLQARQKLPHQAFSELRSQLDADAQTFRAVGAGS